MTFCFPSKSIKSYFSVKQILMGTLFIIFCIILFVIVRIQYLAASSAYEQIYLSNYAALNFFSQSLDHSVSRLDDEFYDLLSNNLSVSILEIDSEDSEIFKAKNNLIDALEKIYNSSEFLNNVFLYSPAGSAKEYFLYSTKLSSASDDDFLKEYVIHTCEASLNGANFSSSNWSIHTIDNVPYLMRIICVNQTFCGGFIRLDTIEEQLNSIYRSGTGSAAIFSSDHQFLLGNSKLADLASITQDSPVLKGESGNYIFSCISPDMLEMEMAIAVPASSLSSLSTTNLTGFIGICAILILLLLLVYFCFFLMYRPFLYLSGSMETVARGNLQFRIAKHSFLREADRIYQTFNTMLDQISSLKAEVYEKELEKEKVSRQFLQMQLKSHFFLNCLNIIYSLAQTKRYELIQKLTMCLVKYFRYLSSNSEELVTLKEEIDHIQNYMEIQMMRFPGKITFSCHVEEELYSCKIPLLILQTFLENAVKYGLDFSRTSPVTLNAVSKKRNGSEGIFFTITDCGKGFSEELIHFYQKTSQPVLIHQNHGIGIINVKNRLHLIYGGKEELTISNHLPCGARIEIWIPKKGGE